jgi:arabinogalactan endo-1,4-beta-galactosidase
MLFWASAPVALGLSRTALGDPFYIGSDVSLVPFFQSQGAVYQASTTSAPQAPDQILYDAGDNLFRVRLFVNPDTNYNDSQGAIQTQAYDISLLQTLKTNDPNAAIELDFHYSDTWASPGEQTKPAAWASDTQAQLDAQIQSYTSTTLTAFGTAGVMPNIVQLGNEINSGMLWGTTSNEAGGQLTGTTQSWQNLGGLLNSAIAGVRTAQGAGPEIQVAIHIANGAQTFTSNGQPSGEPQYFFNDLQTLGGVTDYQIEGVSFYPNSSGSPSITLAGLQANLTALANSYPTKKIMVLETNYPYESNSNYNGWTENQAGQAEEYAAVKNLLLGLPNGAGEGLVYWEPEGVQVPGLSVYNGGDTAMFYLEPGTTNTWIFNPDMAAAFVVPEPASSALLLLAAPLMLRRTRR